MERDNEVSGNGNSYTTEFRQYDPRLGRWKSLDPLMAKFPWMSPYVAFDNNPVYYTDPYGLSSVGSGDVPKGAPDPAKKQDYVDKEGNSWLYNDGKWTNFGKEAKAVGKRQTAYERNSLPKPIVSDNTNVKVDKYIPNTAESKPYVPNTVMKPSPMSPDMELAKKNGQIYKGAFEFFVPGLEILHKLQDGEEITATDIYVEGIGLIPFGKLMSSGGKLLIKIGGKSTDITTKAIKTKAGNALNKFGCFTEGTKISTKEGLKNIEDVVIGDSVWAFNIESNEIALKAVYNTTIRTSNHIIELVIDTDTLYTTDDHPFFVSNTWKRAENLVIGDTLNLLDGSTEILSFRNRVDTTITVYNFAVEDFHSYFVGVQGVLVHNNNCAENVLKPLGKGSTGRVTAKNLTEQLAMKEIMSNPSSGKVLIETMEDASGRWNGWSKMSNKTAHGVEIHYNALRKNGKIVAIDDFKFIGGN